MPEAVQTIMLAAPTTHFVNFAQAILYRGAGLEVVWRELPAITVLGAVFFLARWCASAARSHARNLDRRPAQPVPLSTMTP